MTRYTLITGATGYLGKAFCQVCAENNENLILTGRSIQKLKTLAEEINQINNSIIVLYYPCQLDDENSRSTFFEWASIYSFGKLINVAGADIQKSFESYTQEKISFQIRTNFESTVSFCHFVMKHRAPNLEIINISSVSGINPMPYFAIYSASKSALTYFSLALQEEVRGTGINVLAVLPGAIYTRSDVVDYIKTQGIWGKLAAKQPIYIAQKAYKASQEHKTKIIPGFFNHCIQIFTACIPLKIKLRFIARRWKNTTKDAF